MRISVTAKISCSTVTLHSAVTSGSDTDVTVITVTPGAWAVMLPLASTVAIDSSAELHLTDGSVASEGCTITATSDVSPTLMTSSVLVSDMPVTGVRTTVTLQMAVLSPQVAVMMTSPREAPVTVPASSTVAIDALAVVQVRGLMTAFAGRISGIRVMLCPTLISAEVSLRVRLSTGGRMTVTLHVAVLSPQVAVMVTSPTLRAVTRPVPSTVAIDSSPDDQVTVLSVASSGRISGTRVIVPPTISVATSGLIVMLSTGVGMTVTLQTARALPQAAVTVVSPRAIAVILPSASTVATASLPEVQVTVLSVTSSGKTSEIKVRVSPTIISAVY